MKAGQDGDEIGSITARCRRARAGANTWQRVDKPRGAFFHTNWTGTGERVASSTYAV